MEDISQRTQEQLDGNSLFKLEQKIVQFLDDIFEMLGKEVLTNWNRFAQYFDFWKVFSESDGGTDENSRY